MNPQPRQTEADPLRRGLSAWWPNLPVLLIASLPPAISLTWLRAAPANLTWLVIIGVGLITFPALGVLLNGCDQLLRGNAYRTKDLLQQGPKDHLRALQVTVIPTLTALASHLSFQLWTYSQQTWMLISTSASATVTAVTSLIGVIALPHHLSSNLPTIQLWKLATYVTSRNLITTVGASVLLGATIIGSSRLSFALLVLIPAPLALIWAAASTTAIGRSKATLNMSAEFERQSDGLLSDSSPGRL